MILEKLNSYSFCDTSTSFNYYFKKNVKIEDIKFPNKSNWLLTRDATWTGSTAQTAQILDGFGNHFYNLGWTWITMIKKKTNLNLIGLKTLRNLNPIQTWVEYLIK